MGKARKSFYAVRNGRKTGVFFTWKDCQAQVNGFSGAVFKGFSTRTEADQFVTQGRHSCHSLAARSRCSGDFVSTTSGSRSSGAKGYNTGGGLAGGSRQYYPSGSSWGGSTHRFSSGPSPGGSQHYYFSVPLSGGQKKLPVVYSDGCCFGNGYKMAVGGVGVYWGDGHPQNVSEKLEGLQTNQRAELVSACRALETAIQQGYNEVELRTDSSYTIKAMTKWICTWKENGWRTAVNKPVKNREDIKRLDRLCQQVRVKWTQVPGHTGIQGNEAADVLAKAGAQRC